MAATDPALARLVRIVEELPISEWHVWVVVPGGLISGEMISTRRYMEEFSEQLSLDIQNRAGEAVERLSFSEILPIPDSPPEGEAKYLHLASPVIISGSPALPIHANLTRVRLADVTAWGLGQLAAGPQPGSAEPPGEVSE